jgi:hypothetical protein
MNRTDPIFSQAPLRRFEEWNGMPIIPDIVTILERKNKTRPFTTDRESMYGTQVHLSPACVFLEALKKIPKHAMLFRGKRKTRRHRRESTVMDDSNTSSLASRQRFISRMVRPDFTILGKKRRTLDHGAGRGQETHYSISRRLGRFS